MGWPVMGELSIVEPWMGGPWMGGPWMGGPWNGRGLGLCDEVSFLEPCWLCAHWNGDELKKSLM